MPIMHLAACRAPWVTAGRALGKRGREPVFPSGCDLSGRSTPLAGRVLATGCELRSVCAGRPGVIGGRCGVGRQRLAGWACRGALTDVAQPLGVALPQAPLAMAFMVAAKSFLSR
jgi:hypothetical protein